jgi:hypothetical protein
MALIAFDERPLWVTVLVYVTVVITVLSGLDYFFGLRRRVDEAAAARSGPVPPAAAPGSSSAPPIEP